MAASLQAWQALCKELKLIISGALNKNARSTAKESSWKKGACVRKQPYMSEKEHDVVTLAKHDPV